MRFNDLLELSGLSPDDVTIILNTTNMQPFRDMLPYLANARRDLFDAYQSVHSNRATASLRSRPYMASFLPLPGKRMLFEGLYEIRSSEPKPTLEIYSNPAFAELENDFGAIGTGPEANIQRAVEQIQFDFAPLEQLAEYRGRLVILTPSGRTYARLASNLDVAVSEITAAPQFTPPVPHWREFSALARFVRNMPSNWADALRQWRGVYLIVDQQDGQRYVGSAYGQENLLGRWQSHVAGSVGVTAALRRRDPETFRFSVLELLSPAASADEVIAIENGWKERLQTREFGLNEN